MVRIGQGYDAHRFQVGRKLILGGVDIPHEQGIAAHSDGDVVVHALCNALLGAAALGDIGQHFPDTSEEFANIDSRLLLRRVVHMLQDQRYQISNVDMTIVAQAPKMAPHINKMRDNLAHDLSIHKDRVSVKATTTEKMGFVGRQEGIAAYAVALLLEPD